jgi:polyhydroxyalkanoate synthesis regulator protein
MAQQAVQPQRAESPTVRILKKYPNRRLYDTVQSCFVALEDVKRLVLSGEPFEVHDSKTGEVITRSVLLQIIAEQDADSDSLHGLLREYLERSMAMFMEQQGAFHDQLRTILSGHPLNLMSRLAEQNLDIWSRLAGTLRGDATGDAGQAKK